jgi:aminoglycoside phosphotransferase family enzyme/predicted kinase
MVFRYGFSVWNKGFPMERNHLAALLDPAAYSEQTNSVSLVQTHVSFLFITDTHVYKIKKPVDFGFLNFTTVDRRRFFCEEEVRLNRRLCPDVYLGVVELRESPSGVSFHGAGKVIDYAVRMKRLPGDRMLDRLLEGGMISGNDIRRIARVIGEFHLHAERSGEIDGYGSVEVIRRNWEENFRQIAPFVSRTLAESDLRLLRAWVERFMVEQEGLFAQRVSGGHIRDCDGDLHSENICLDDRVYIFDCIEFNARFRYSDTASDISFLLMDLEFRGRRDLTEELLHEYLTVTGDREMMGVLDFYRVYRAFVRGKVESFRLNDTQLPLLEKESAAGAARRHFRLARGYALRSMFLPGLFAFAGLMGVGKSTLARELSFQLGVDLISSDVLRKEMAGIPAAEHRRDAYNEGIYTPEFTRRTYGEMFRRAGESLRDGRGVIVDASFSRREDRTGIADLARRMGVPFHLFHVVCPEEVILGRLEARTDDPFQVSDGRLELIARQREDFEPISAGEECCTQVESSAPVEETIDIILRILGLL